MQPHPCKHPPPRCTRSAAVRIRPHSGYRTFKLPPGTTSEYGRSVKWLGDPVTGPTPRASSWATPPLRKRLSRAKPSGIATATRRLVQEADGRIRIVGGAWKKVSPQTRAIVRHAVPVGGGSVRMAGHPMIYLDQNYVRMLGGVASALNAVSELPACSATLSSTHE